MALAKAVLMYGLRSAQPAAAPENDGCYFRVEDEGDIIEQSDGSAWIPIGSSGGGGAPTTATYVTESADAGLSAESVLGSKVVTTAADASKQAAAISGRLFLPNDGFYLYRDAGAAWAPWGPLYPLVVPIDGDYAWINQGGASVDAVRGAITLTAPATAGDNVRVRKKAAPGTPYTITALFAVTFTAAVNNNGFAGLCWRQASDGKLVVAGVSTQGSIFGVYKYSSPTAFSATYVNHTRLYNVPMVWLRLADNATNRIVSLSYDGVNFLPIHTVGRTDFLTADEVGFMVNEGNNAASAYLTLISWKEA